MPRGADQRRQREASSDASLWDDLDEADRSFSDIVTPPLNTDPPLAPPPARHQHNTASNPITISDSTAPTSTQRPGLDLELELFPSDSPPIPPSSSTSRSQKRNIPSSFDFEAAAGSQPRSQQDLKATQYLREEWLISAGQKQPDDLVQDHIPYIALDEHPISTEKLESPSRIAANSSNMASLATSALAPSALADTSIPHPARRGRSSLLDQLDVICSSPSPHSSSPIVPDNAAIQQSPAAARSALRPITSLVANAKAASTEHDMDERAALDMLNMSCSPPSQLSQSVQCITLIQDMPPEKQEIYHRLAFGSSSSAAPTNVGTTVRGTRGKTWQTTWNDDADDMDDDDLDATGTNSRSKGASSSSTSARLQRAAATTSTGSTRGRKASSSATGSRRATSVGKARSSSSSASGTSRGRSRFFASRARGGWRGRGRGRGR